jgi:hypothetical protein
MVDATEPLSVILWAVFAFAAGMYPLGFLFPTPCSKCCKPPCGDLFEFKRCARFEAVTQGTRGNSFTQDNASQPLFRNGWPAIPTPTHGFSRSIARPEDIGVFRVTDEARFRVTARISFAQADEVEVRFTLRDRFTAENLEAIYTFTIQLDEQAEAITQTKTSDRASTIVVHQSALSYNEVTLVLMTPEPVGRTVFHDYRGEYEGWLQNNDWSSWVYLQYAPFTENAGAVEVLDQTFAYACKIDDFQYASSTEPFYAQSEYVWDKDAVLSFLNGESPQRYVDPYGKEWDVTIQGDTPLCGIHYSQSLADVDVPYLLTAEVPASDCPNRKRKFDMLGCADRLGQWLAPKNATHSALYRTNAITYGANGFTGNQIRNEELVRTNGYGFPYMKEVPEHPEDAYSQSSVCLFRQEQEGCSVPAIESIPSEAFFCGDLLWVMENGPCYDTVTLTDRGGRTTVYTLNTGGSSEANEATRKWCMEQNETAHQSNIYVVYDYRPRFDGTCWPPTGTVHFPATWYPQNVETSIDGNIHDANYNGETFTAYWYSDAGEGGWQQKSEFTLHLVTAGCESAMYESRHASAWAQWRVNVSRKCDGTFTVDSAPLSSDGFSKIVSDPSKPNNYINIARLDAHADARIRRSNEPWGVELFSFTAGASGPPPVASSVQSVSGDPVPAGGGVVTVQMSGNGLGDMSSTFTLGKNLMRFPRTVFLQPNASKRVNGSPIGSPSYELDPALAHTLNAPFVQVTQKGYGGDDDTKCHIAVVWIGGVQSVGMPRVRIGSSSELGWLLGQSVTSDFTKVSCLVGQPSVVEGTTCEWTVTSDNEHVLAKSEDGLVKVTVGPGALDASQIVYVGGMPTRQISARLTFATPLEESVWQVAIKLA